MNNAVVTRDGQEVEWFENEKAASAYVQHVYGLSPYDLIGHPSVAIGGIREPRGGDLVCSTLTETRSFV